MAVSHSGDLTGRLLGERYALRARLGEGGMGVVYRAQDRMLQRDVAVKVFREGATEAARTTSETQLLAGLNHPALVTLYDAHVGAEEPRYLVMEYVDGPTLQERLERGPLTDSTAARIARDLGEALHVVHDAGIVHRDVKPANVLLRAPGFPGEEFHAKLADFGIAYLVNSARLTTPGTIIGSAAYLSPEQVTGADPLPASDIYSLGLVLLEALTGQRAFTQDGVREAVLARLAEDPVVPASVGQGWGTLLTAMIARDPSDRPTALDVVVGVRTLGSVAPSSFSAVSSSTVRQPGAELKNDAPHHSGGSASAADVDAGLGATRVLTAESTAVQTAEQPSSGVETTPGRRRPRWLAWLAPMVLVVVAATIIIGGMSNGGAGDQPAAPPTLPALEEPLASHLQQLLDSVSP